MVVATALPSIDDLAADAAAGQVVKDYLRDRGIATLATLALLAKDEAGLERVLIQPLQSGWKKTDGSSLTIQASEQPIVAAILTHMWQAAQSAWDRHLANSKATPAGPSSAPTTTSSSTASSADDKPPKTLAPGRWASLVASYQSQQIGGLDRLFPTHELLGAEAILARALWEREVSKQYTPIGLGELIQCRTFQANGEPNPLNKREQKATTLSIQNEKLVANSDEPWTPRSILSILDGLNSVRWAHILIQMGSERSVHAFYDWLVRLARSRPLKTDQFGQFYITTSWKLALEMRSGRSFEEVTSILMKDFDAFSECMSRDPVQPGRGKQSPAKSSDNKGSGKANTKSKNHRFQPYRQPWRSNQNQYDRSYQRYSGPASDDKSWAQASQDWKPTNK